jgi:hypothetical protein
MIASANYTLAVVNDGDTGATGATGAQGPKGDTGSTGAKGADARTYVTLVSEDDLNAKRAKDTVYVNTSTSICASLLNKPNNFIAGEVRMEVEECGSSNYLIQRLYAKAGNDSKSWSRTYSAGTFGSWVELGTKGEKGDTGATGATGAQGLKGDTGAKGDTGSAGVSSTSVQLNLSAFQVPVNVSGLAQAASTVTISFGGFLGATRKACTATVGTLPSGMSSSVTQATVSADGTITLSIAKNATLGNVLAGTITITLSCNSQSFSRKICWTKAVDALALQEEIESQADDISSINTNITGLTTSLAAKASQSDLNALGGDVEDNASAISGLATRVSSAEGTITAHGTSISQNATAIQSKASQSSVNTLSNTVSSHGTQITQQAESITALATRVTNAEDTNTAQATSISQNASAIALKASQADLNTLSGTVSSHTSSITQNANAIATKVTQTQVDTSIATAKSANYGYRYATDITVYGDSDKFYPVIIKAGNQNVKREIFVFRDYSEQAPSDWYTSTHKGGLTLKIKCNFGGWGGADYSWEIVDLEQSYSLMFSGAATVMSYMAFAIFLRGGGTTGAIYHLYSDQSLTTSMYGIASPQICYSQESIGVSGQYHWEAPAYRAMKNSASGSNALLDAYAEEIRIRRITKLAQDDDTRLSTAESTIISHTTSITQNATDIALKADKTTVNSLSSTVTSHGTSISQNATNIALKADKTTVDSLSGTVTSQGSLITQNADAISARIQSYDANGNAVTGAKLEIGTKDGSGYIQLDATKVIIDGSVKAASIDVNDLMAKDLTIGNAVHSSKYDKDGNVIVQSGKGFYLGSDGRLLANQAVLESSTMTSATVSGTFTSEEFSTQSASDNTVSLSFTESPSSYDLAEFRDFAIDLAENYGTVVANSGNGVEAYQLTGVTGSYRGTSFTTILADGWYGVKTIWTYTTPYVTGGVLKFNVSSSLGGSPAIGYAGPSEPSSVSSSYGSWSSANNCKYMSFSSTCYNRFSAIALNSVFSFSGTVTYGQNSISSSSSSMYKIQKTSSSVQLFSPSMELLLTLTVGEYYAFTLVMDISIQASLAGIAVKNISPKSGSVFNIGSSTMRFKEIWGVTINGSAVWGAVAN